MTLKCLNILVKDYTNFFTPNTRDLKDLEKSLNMTNMYPHFFNPKNGKKILKVKFCKGKESEILKSIQNTYIPRYILDLFWEKHRLTLSLHFGQLNTHPKHVLCVKTKANLQLPHFCTHCMNAQPQKTQLTTSATNLTFQKIQKPMK